MTLARHGGARLLRLALRHAARQAALVAPVAQRPRPVPRAPGAAVRAAAAAGEAAAAPGKLRLGDPLELQRHEGAHLRLGALAPQASVDHTRSRTYVEFQAHIHTRYGNIIN